MPPAPFEKNFVGILPRALALGAILICSAQAQQPAPAPQHASVPTLSGKNLTLTGSQQLHITSPGTPLESSNINFASPDAWLFLDNIRPSQAIRFLGQMKVGGAPAALNNNIRVAQYGQGSVVIPHGPDFPALTLCAGKAQTGPSLSLKCYEKYDDATLGEMAKSATSLRLKRGYMATLAQNKDGTGISQNYVAQDHDVVVELPAGLDKNVAFVRIFPWRWVSKKGMAGDIWPKFNCGWYYNWNLNKNSTPDIEYVPIRQNLWWPGLDKQDWKERGATHLLGYNEPDHKDQSNLTVDEAIAHWPDLLATGLRVGSPAVSDGGLGWLFDFMKKAEARGLRVDFVAVHYYRSRNSADPEGAAQQFYDYLKQIHDRTNRPLWVTEWNNGANWTKDKDPT
ncbi:MAG: glycosyl hydrolase, partial [Chthoniobacterales bacterium]